ncbi:hypothetical protein [Alkalihalophilus marmarensis]|uniref:Uncharacterized protein n=1 Tax=Alkalihalophilus marmarensis DSM 21297 TaxID=1188261 RepID=U6STT3_9BACI|nr:hypothetical protein [Alkalihalophilus marmarensis]ERN54305.1 hypothetical protein A33I_07715 [Alkalihalophilus marmarensis DSM 21297]
MFNQKLKTNYFTYIHNGHEFEVKHMHFGYARHDQDQIDFTYKDIPFYFRYYPIGSTPEQMVSNLCKAVDHGGKDSVYKFNKLYSDLRWIKYRYIILDGKVYDHENMLPNARKKHIYKVEFKNGKIVRNISGTKMNSILTLDDPDIFRSSWKSLLAIELNAKAWHKKTSSLPKDKHFNQEHTDQLDEIMQFFDECGI